MDLRASDFFKHALAIFGIPLTVLTRLFRQSEVQINDIESQSTTLCHTLEDDFNDVLSPNPESWIGPERTRSIPENASISSMEGSASENAQIGPRYADEPSQVITHEDRMGSSFLAIPITESMVSNVQAVVKDFHELRIYEKEFDNIGRQILSIRRQLESTSEELAAAAETENETLQQKVDQLKSNLNDFCQERDILDSRLQIFRSNLSSSHNLSHALFEGILGKAGLLVLPEPGPQDDHEVSMSELQLEAGSLQSDSTPVLLDELFSRTTYESVVTLWQHLTEAEDMFNDLEAKYDRDEAMYDAAVADGEDVPTRSDFDLMFLRHKMELTTYIINKRKTYEDERENAIALGVIRSDWGTPSEYGSDAGYSSPDDDVERAAKRDYTSVFIWMESLPKMFDESHLELTCGNDCNSGLMEVRDQIDMADDQGHANKVIQSWQRAPQLMEVDEWDAKTVEISDSHSLVDVDEYTSKNIRRWQEIRGCK